MNDLQSFIADMEAAVFWCKQVATKKFQDAAQEEPGSYERRFIEHGATCYLNAAERMEHVILRYKLEWDR
jgi:hypothetical protein